MTDIEKYLFSIYGSKTKMYRKIYYYKNRDKIKTNNLNRYYKNLNKELSSDVKFTKKEFIIKFD